MVATYVSLKVTPQDVDCILYFDCTKLGVLQQAEINMLGDYAEKLLFKNPQRPILIFEQGPKPVLHYFFCDLRAFDQNPGGVLVLIPPLLVGAESGGSLRGDMRQGGHENTVIAKILF